MSYLALLFVVTGLLKEVSPKSPLEGEEEDVAKLLADLSNHDLDLSSPRKATRKSSTNSPTCIGTWVHVTSTYSRRYTSIATYTFYIYYTMTLLRVLQCSNMSSDVYIVVTVGVTMYV